MTTVELTGRTASFAPIACCRAPFRRLARWLAHRAAARALAELDDYLLKDMGIARLDIEAAVPCGIARKPIQPINQ
ncbi:MAG: DUF1127 domain-containing protein [Aestuariivirga sp.]